MSNYVVKTDDKIVQQVIEKIDQRSLIGQAKYGAMMMEEVEGKDKDLNDFLIDVQEEIMDALLYIQAARACLRDEVEEAMLNRMNIIGQNGNDGLHYDEDHALDLVLNDMVKDIEVDEEETL